MVRIDVKSPRCSPQCYIIWICWKYLKIRRFKKNLIHNFGMIPIPSSWMGSWRSKPLSQLVPLIWPIKGSRIVRAPWWVCLWYWIWTAKHSQGQKQATLSYLSCSWLSVTLLLSLCWSPDSNDTDVLAYGNCFPWSPKCAWNKAIVNLYYRTYSRINAHAHTELHVKRSTNSTKRHIALYQDYT